MGDCKEKGYGSHNKRKMMFVLHTSKTHWKDVKPQVTKITATPCPELCNNSYKKPKLSYSCPFQLLADYMAVRRKPKTPEEQFFIFRDRTTVKPIHMRTILRQALAKCGLDPNLYGYHSTRLGRALDLLTKCT